MWIIPDQLSSAFARASECSTKQFALSSQEVKLRACVSGKPTLRPSSWSGWKTRPWSPRLFGAVISGTSTAARFVEWWTCSLRACPASPTASPDSAKATPTTAATAPTTKGRSPISFASSGNVSPPWCSSKTFLPGFETKTSGFDPSAKLYAEWVTRSLSLSLSLRNRLERATNEKGCSSSLTAWTTPQAHDIGERGSGQVPTSAAGNACLARDARTWTTPAAADRANRGNRARPEDQRIGGEKNLADDVQNWGTPTSHHRTHDPRQVDHGEQLANQANTWETPMAGAATRTAQGGIQLNQQTQNWQTPGTDSFRSRGGDRKDEAGLNRQAMLWSTPRGHQAGPDFAKKDRSNTGMELQAQAEAFQESAWPTPAAQNWRDERSNQTHNSRPLQEVVARIFPSSPPDPKTPDGQKSSTNTRILRRRLNPAFACWLMGLPAWRWTHPGPINSGASEIAASRSRQRRLLSSFFGTKG